nr:MAG TPA: hypothetical protein [Caudoviricetes sp.]DAO76414.1 MAG TPA: hypothetical protein [Bacteriophage sp.]
MSKLRPIVAETASDGLYFRKDGKRWNASPRKKTCALCAAAEVTAEYFVQTN